MIRKQKEVIFEVTTSKKSASDFSKSALEQFQFEVASELGITDKLKSSPSSTKSSDSSRSSSSPKRS